MRKLSFILAFVGLFALISILVFQEPLEITSEKQLTSLIQNQLVLVSGKVIKQTQYTDIITLKLNNNITLTYSGKHQNFLNSNISSIGLYDNFQYPKIKILEIRYGP
ncbi:MAG: hypothetical protein AABW80_05530 [Nanoarchaeota archaeon]